VVTGGNTDVRMVAKIIDKGLIRTYRLLRLTLQLLDMAGTLGRLSSYSANYTPPSCRSHMITSGATFPWIELSSTSALAHATLSISRPSYRR
jgi:hypothetical protein